MSPPTIGDLELIWRELADHGQSGVSGRQTRRVLPDSRHDCFLGIQFPLARRLLSVSVNEPDLVGAEGRTLTSGILVTQTSATTTGQPTLDLVLRDPQHADIFTALTADLLQTLATNDAPNPGTTVLSRLEDWRHLLAAAKPEGMSAEQQRGLYGELTVLADTLLPNLGPRAVHAWTGPERHLQDFQFPTLAIEVKTVSATNDEAVRIANERQLDHLGPGQLFLATLALDGRRGGTGQTLPELVARLRANPNLAGAGADFENKLILAGFLDTQSHLYEQVRYRVRRTRTHKVGAGFPRITENDLPDGVSDVSYTVNLMAASAHSVSPLEFLDALTEAAL
ncbi:PD-(D/E)XK motif protein [Micromonospora arida]|uniref:PD-(D/E)XK motif protein n=1 Tax=Micromonospora arida TaxID=2203715 RepID=UPI003CF23B69